MQKTSRYPWAAAFLAVAFLISSGAAKAYYDPSEADASESDRHKVHNATLVEVPGIENARAEKLDNSKVKIAFDIVNGKTIQPQVRYSVQMLEKSDKGTFVVDEKVFDEVLILGSMQKVHKEIEHVFPKYLRGDLQVMVKAVNMSGMLLAANFAGEVAAGGNEAFVKVANESCYLTVSGETDKRYDPFYFGVDISDMEKLTLHCQLNNKTGRKLELTPVFETFRRTIAGKSVGTTESGKLPLEVGEQKDLALELPRADEPQAYDTVLRLKDERGQFVANEIKVHWVLRGESATIRNLMLDKDSYRKGETAKLDLNWSGPADAFYGSRAGGEGTQMSQLLAKAEIVNGKGKRCSEPYSGKIDQNSQAIQLELPIVTNCSDPDVTVAITDGQGKVLDQSTFRIKTAVQEGKSENKIDMITQPMSMREKMLIFAGLPTLLLLLFLVFRKRKTNGGVGMIILAVMAGVFLIGQDAKASQFTVSGCEGPGQTHCRRNDYTVWLTNTTSTWTCKGNTKTCFWASGSAVAYACENGGIEAILRARFSWEMSQAERDNVGGAGIQTSWANGHQMFYYPVENGSPAGSVVVEEPSDPGLYFVRFCGNGGTIGCLDEYFQVDGNYAAPVVTPSCAGANSQAAVSWQAAPSGYTSYRVILDTDQDIDNGYWLNDIDNLNTLSLGGAPAGFVSKSVSGIPDGTPFSGYLTSGMTYNVAVAYKNGGWLDLTPWTSFTAASCVQFTCLDPPPANATPCLLDDAGLTVSTPKAAVAACSLPAGSAPKCEYTCTPPYVFSGGFCIAPPCDVNSACPSYSAPCTGDGTSLFTPVSAWHGVAACTALGAAADECQCLCNDDFVWNAGTQKCVCQSAGFQWVPVDPPGCVPGDNCLTKIGDYLCYNSCNQPASESDCIASLGNHGDPPKKNCPCSSRDNTYREVNP